MLQVVVGVAVSYTAEQPSPDSEVGRGPVICTRGLTVPNSETSRPEIAKKIDFHSKCDVASYLVVILAAIMGWITTRTTTRPSGRGHHSMKAIHSLGSVVNLWT